MDHKKALHSVLSALNGLPHQIRELQATRGLPENPIDFLIDEFNNERVYPISHGTHIIQYHDETFVWYDEAGLQGGVTYSLEQAQEALKKYSEDLSKSLEDLEAEELKAFKAYLAANPMATYWSTWLASSALGRSPKEASDGR